MEKKVETLFKGHLVHLSPREQESEVCLEMKNPRRFESPDRCTNTDEYEFMKAKLQIHIHTSPNEYTNLLMHLHMQANRIYIYMTYFNLQHTLYIYIYVIFWPREQTHNIYLQAIMSHGLADPECREVEPHEVSLSCLIARLIQGELQQQVLPLDPSHPLSPTICRECRATNQGSHFFL